MELAWDSVHFGNGHYLRGGGGLHGIVFILDFTGRGSMRWELAWDSVHFGLYYIVDWTLTQRCPNKEEINIFWEGLLAFTCQILYYTLCFICPVHCLL